MASGFEKCDKRTRLVHEGSRRSQYGEMAEALFLTQGFVYPSAESAEERFIKASEDEFIYARYGNPTTKTFEERVAAIEGTQDAFATASGMAAISTTLCAILQAGDHIVSSRAVFGSTLYILEEILPRFGVMVTFVDGADLEQWRSAVTSDTRAVFFETISNPTLEVSDIRAICDIAHEVGALAIVDNVFATPIFSRAVEQGADVVIYSTTKHIDGQGRALGGIICGSHEFIRQTIEPYAKHTGSAMSPFTSWLMLGGLTTLDLRCRAMAESALHIALALEGNPKFAKVIYPGIESHPQYELTKAQTGSGGTVVTFDFGSDKSDKEAAFRFLNALKIIKISNNIGDAKSIATHPSTTTHRNLPDWLKEALHITPGMVRLSVGLESPDDLLDDILQAIGAV